MADEQGTLYLCATPIGNLEDISLRVLDTLRDVDIIACEDTRNSIKLFNHYEIKKPLWSYHEYNRYDKAFEIIEKLREGKNIAVVTDAGTPLISDPGDVLVKECINAGIRVTSLPGPCACITALSLCGLDTRRFVFEGFLPPDKKEREEILEKLKDETRTTVIYEAPHHLLKTLKELKDHLGDREISLCRELTKIHEEVIKTTLFEAVSYYENSKPRGEYVICIGGRDAESIKKENEDKYRDMTLESHMEIYLKQGYDNKESMKLVAKDRGISKREVYNALIKGSAGEDTEDQE
ncbi:MAG: 16S rRNA (cytidine(1402)-2'-O)-methyltransferase [Lachnospiraceae bacterium]|nr:16S rRNA (cytidine(1402)-2'-O)-methyltransferase [Lachnospiraceae bacterium]